MACRANLMTMRCVHSLRKLCHSRGLSQLIGMAHNRTLKLYRPAGGKLLVAYVETGTST